MISVIFATCGRPDYYLKALGSLLNTVSGHDIELVSVIDGVQENAISTLGCSIKTIIDWCPTRRGAIWAWNRGLQISTGDIIVPAGDDQIFHPGWLDYALESHGSKVGGYGVIGMNDLAYDGTKQTSTMLLFDRKFCKEVMGGVICPPVYNYYDVDSEWNEKSKQMHKFFWDERSRVEHLHSAHLKRPKDELDQEREDSNWIKIDEEIFNQRKANNFPITWQSVI